MAGKCGFKLAYFLAGLGIGGVFALLISLPPLEGGRQDPPANAGLKGGPMQEEIGKVAGAIWNLLNAKGELTLAQLKKQVKAKEPVMDWAIGWLAREGKILIKQEKRSIRVRLQ
jgi:Winged helix-turn-helix domain (DUF2582)